MTDPMDSSSGELKDEMSEYLQTFLDETEEQLEDLVETLLVLESEPENRAELHEAFRLIHSIKGSAGMMGFDSIAVLTHHLENRFEQFRSGVEKLDQPTMNLVLRCIDFLRECNRQLRSGESMGSSGALLEELRALEQGNLTSEKPGQPQQDTVAPEDARTIAGDLVAAALAQEASGASAEAEDLFHGSISELGLVRVRVFFEPDLQLVDLKAELIVSRLSGMGAIQSTTPPLEELAGIPDLAQFEVVIESSEDPDALRKVADVDGVQSIELGEISEWDSGPGVEQAEVEEPSEPAEVPWAGHQREEVPPLVEAHSPVLTAPAQVLTEIEPREPTPASPSPRQAVESPVSAAAPREDSSSQVARTKVAETVRVDIERLDHLMNLAGELVVNRARFVQVSRQLNPALKKSKLLNRLGDLGESLRRVIESMQHLNETDDAWTTQIQELQAGLQLLDEQAEVWDQSRRCFGQITEAIDQLTRVSDNIQRGVLETRMVPVGPLFNRFKRVVRDLSVERGKRVHLHIRGEQTELDKRMIDELGDPLVHLVRNAIDHGLEAPEVRTERGKPEVGTILLEASHSGNNVYVRVSDDGGGIDVERIKTKLLDKQLLSPAELEELSAEEVIDYIWHPGFSTAKEITDVSGRGVGMDVVKTRITDLNGAIDVTSKPGAGSTFTIRLPLTLAIIHSLLVRMRNIIFSMPISDVREIVSVKTEAIVNIRGKQTFEVRGTFIPLVGIEDVFEWNDPPTASRNGIQEHASTEAPPPGSVNVVILQTGGKASTGSSAPAQRVLGLRVDELLGGQEIVIKSLSENFVSIPGLSGASILGDGTVCLMLDVASVIEMATHPSRKRDHKERPFVNT